MTTEKRHITVSGIEVDVLRKDIKNFHLGVYPPDGRVRVAAPLALTDDAVRMAVIDKLGWIKRQQAKFAEQPRQSQREMVSGESHYFLGRRYRLCIKEHDAKPNISLRGSSNLDFFVQSGTTIEQREAIFLDWHRKQLKATISPLLEKWQSTLSVQISAWGIKKMKTKWGSCNVGSQRIWFNLELIKKPPQCLEYIVVHELMHLVEPQHNDRFRALMDNHFPQWRHYREVLNEAPLGHEDWSVV